MCVCIACFDLFEQSSLRYIFSLLSFSEIEKVRVGTKKALVKLL